MLNTLSRKLLIPVIALILWSPALHAADIAIFDVMSAGSGVGDMTGVRVSILDQFFGPGTSPSYQLFENLTITPADVGTTFTLTIADDADFAVFEQMVTNGVDNTFGYFVENVPGGGGVGHTFSESSLFAAGTHIFGPGNFTSIGQLSGPDYAGYDILQITLTVDSFSLISGGGSHSHDFRATAKISTVPEPGSIAMLGSGITLLGLRRRRRS